MIVMQAKKLLSKKPTKIKLFDFDSTIAGEQSRYQSMSNDEQPFL